MNKKKISKKILYIVLSIMIISVFTLTIAYAVLSSSLVINGSTEVSGSSWNIVIENFDMSGADVLEMCSLLTSFGGTCHDESYITYGTGKLLTKPNISGTTVSGYEISLTKPGDEVYLAFHVTNNGTIPAKLSSITNSIPYIESSNNNTSDVIWGETNIIFNGNMWKNFTNQFPVDSILCPGEGVELQVYLKIPDEVKTIPSSGLVISNLETKIVFEQVDKSVCSS